jgi:hypothetical protein
VTCPPSAQPVGGGRICAVADRLTHERDCRPASSDVINISSAARPCQLCQSVAPGGSIFSNARTLSYKPGSKHCRPSGRSLAHCGYPGDGIAIVGEARGPARPRPSPRSRSYGLRSRLTPITRPAPNSTRFDAYRLIDRVGDLPNKGITRLRGWLLFAHDEFLSPPGQTLKRLPCPLEVPDDTCSTLPVALALIPQSLGHPLRGECQPH